MRECWLSWVPVSWVWESARDSWSEARLRLVWLSCLASALCIYSRTVPGCSRAFGIARPSHSEFGGRRQIWQAGFDAFGQHPLLGSGPDTFALAFATHAGPRICGPVEWNHTPVRAHNEVIHVLATQGFVGGAAILVLAGGILLSFRRAWIQQAVQARPLLLVVMAGLAGFAIQVLFSFTVAGCGTLFVTLAAILSRWGEIPAEPELQSEPASTAGLARSLTIAAVLAALVLGYNASPGARRRQCGYVRLGCLAIAGALVLSVLVILQMKGEARPGLLPGNSGVRHSPSDQKDGPLRDTPEPD